MAHILMSYDKGEQVDRRLETRVEWNGPVKYRPMQMDHFKTGILVNISDGGAMLWLNEDIPVGSEIEVLVQSEHAPEPVHMYMHIVRIEEISREGYTGYACKLEMAVDEAG